MTTCSVARADSITETDPPACLQPLIAIIPQRKQSIHARTQTETHTIIFTFVLTCPRRAPPRPPPPPSLKKVALPPVVEVVSTNAVPKKDDPLRLQVPDWSCGVLLIHPCPPAPAAASRAQLAAGLWWSSLNPGPQLPLRCRDPTPDGGWDGVLEWKRGAGGGEEGD